MGRDNVMVKGFQFGGFFGVVRTSHIYLVGYQGGAIMSARYQLLHMIPS